MIWFLSIFVEYPKLPLPPPFCSQIIEANVEKMLLMQPLISFEMKLFFSASTFFFDCEKFMPFVCVWQQTNNWLVLRTVIIERKKRKKILKSFYFHRNVVYSNEECFILQVFQLKTLKYLEYLGIYPNRYRNFIQI